MSCDWVRMSSQFVIWRPVDRRSNTLILSCTWANNWEANEQIYTVFWNAVQGPYIGGKYLTSADLALAPRLYVLQIALAYYKNWTNFEQFYPALNKFMKVRQVLIPPMNCTSIITAPWSQFRSCLKPSNTSMHAWLAYEIVAAHKKWYSCNGPSPTHCGSKHWLTCPNRSM